jgi:hypothetical protein
MTAHGTWEKPANGGLFLFNNMITHRETSYFFGRFLLMFTSTATVFSLPCCSWAIEETVGAITRQGA